MKPGGEQPGATVTNILSDGRVEFRFYRPRAERVFVAGTFNGWRTDASPMRQEPDGWWRATLAFAPGVHQFRYVADGEWYTDFAAHGLEHGKFGFNSLLVIPELGTRIAA
jgi:1,4-alpha-glucan branching enzyme